MKNPSLSLIEILFRNTTTAVRAGALAVALLFVGASTAPAVPVTSGDAVRFDFSALQNGVNYLDFGVHLIFTPPDVMREHPDEENEPTIGSTMIDAEHFVETTEDLQVLGSLCAILPDQQCWTEGAGDTLTRAKNRLLH